VLLTCGDPRALEDDELGRNGRKLLTDFFKLQRKNETHLNIQIKKKSDFGICFWEL
jgi:hypothetical protein